jgi:catechol 2,3-dioxygenase
MGFFDHLEATEVRLRVRDGAWMARFYGDALGFVVSDLGAGEIEVSAGAGLAPLVRLIVDPAARRATAGSAGLFHVAFLYPDRAGLGGAVRRLVDRGAAFADGDHGVSEAIYLEDPEGNGIELYADRPPEVWPRGAGGDVAMYTRSVDVGGCWGRRLRARERRACESGTCI